MYILSCEAFDSEVSARHRNVCCSGDCHDRKTLIAVTPYAQDATLENRTLDWSLGIQGNVCCGRYEFVRSLSREWWVRKLGEVNNWSEEMVKSYLGQGSWHRTFDKAGRNSQSKPVKNQVKAQNCPNCGSVWNEVVCNGCGHS